MNLPSSIAHYRIISQLGAGGMGVVYRATDTRLRRDVALKVLPRDMAQNPGRLARFRREARAVAALNHPHIVTLYSVEEADGIHFLTMELVEGRPLRGMIPKDGFPVPRILDMALALAEALAAAHEKGLVHRDLKPANIMVTPDGRVKVVDFGLAKYFSVSAPIEITETLIEDTKIGMVVGTPPYMSPEQISGRNVDHRTDIFSLGVILHEMSVGRRPFRGATKAELAASILRDHPPPVTEQRPDLPAELAGLIQQCLAKNLAGRLQSARLLAEALREARHLHVDSAPSSRKSAPPAGEESFWVAVLPFKYKGSNADLQALAEGLFEEILTGLSRFSYLRVIAQSSTSRFAHEAADPFAAGRQVGARYVMEGSLHQAGSHLRATVQLVDTASGAHLWAETYERVFQPEEIFALQDDIASRIVSTVADQDGVLPYSMAQALRHKNADELSPLEAVMRTFSYFKRHAPQEHAEVRRMLENAVRKAPDHGACWSALSVIYGHEYLYGFPGGPDPLGRALAAAHRSVELTPSNNLAYAALAATLFLRKEILAFRPVAERTIELNPMDGSIISFMGHLIAYSGDWERGCALSESAARLNPHHAGWHHLLAFVDAYRKGEYRAALEAALKVNMPGYWVTFAARAAAMGQIGEREAAQKEVKELLEIRPNFAFIVRDALAVWHEPELIEHLVDGLRKAGLDVPNP
jgi:serine/threonine protein kinase/tetratricopeptide (TPR) repeat protein